MSQSRGCEARNDPALFESSTQPADSELADSGYRHLLEVDRENSVCRTKGVIGTCQVFRTFTLRLALFLRPTASHGTTIFTSYAM